VIGQTFDVYKIIEKRGEGGMGVFYKAHDERLDRIVGFKTLHPELFSDPEFRAKLEREAKSLARLNHKNIVTVYQYLIHEGHHFIVMEYVEGRTLSEKIADWGTYSFSDAAKIVLQVLDAIGYAHQQGVIHRDIKPSNIMISDQDEVKVTDFGIAKLLDSAQKTRTGQGAGSLYYMAPEQIQHGDVDGRTDIYALGITFFEMISGAVPFTGESEFMVMKKHLEETPRPPSTFNSAIQKAQDELVLHAMEKNPADRFPTAADFSNAIHDVLSFSDSAVGVIPPKKRTMRKKAAPSRTTRPEEKTARKKFKTGWVYAVAVILVAVAVYIAFRPAEEPEPPPFSHKPDTIVAEQPTTTTTERESLVVAEDEEPVSEDDNQPVVEEDKTPESEDDTRPEVQREEAAQPPPAGVLDIDVTPPDQRSKVIGIWVDQQHIGNSVPLELRNQPRGLHWIRIETDYGNLTDTVTWTGTDRRLLFFLTEKTSRLGVGINIDFADLYIDDQEIYIGAPCRKKVLVGPHKIEVKREGYRTPNSPRIVRVAGTGKTTTRFELRPR